MGRNFVLPPLDLRGQKRKTDRHAMRKQVIGGTGEPSTLKEKIESF